MNNFDISSTGENIEFNCFYDSCLSQMYFDEFVSEAVRVEIGRNFSAFILGDASKPFFKKSALQKMTKGALFDLGAKYDLTCWTSSPKDYEKADLISDLLNVTIEQHYTLTAKNGWGDFIDSIEHDYHQSNGYSQGDSLIVISLDKTITPSMAKYYDNIFWDAPVYISATVNDREFYTDEFLTDYYEWDRDAVKAKILALPVSDYAKTWLVDALPEYPRY
jgi:hypothetical protein